MIRVDDYDYILPPEQIAQHPLENRADARLLVVRRQDESIEHYHVRDLPTLLQAGDCLIVNDTKVLPARLVGYRTSTGGRWFGLYLDSTSEGLWRILAKTRGKVLIGESVTVQDPQGADAFQLKLVTRLPDGSWVVRPQATRGADSDAHTLLEQFGRVPLPHYIRDGEMNDRDQQSYQTVFANRPGAVAAPTAGLHFTPQLLSQLQTRSIARAQVTLHVGVGTFRPMAGEFIEQHQMHTEWAELNGLAAENIQRTRASGGRLIAVGTTSVRVLETAAQNKSGPDLNWTGETNLFIHPPFTFQLTDGLLTNFHLPRSTLLVLVRTFGGDQLIQRAYQQAIDEEYRFYSYGDAMLIL